MTDQPQFSVEPAPGVSISDADIPDLPLAHFHLVIIVEPDPETWMPQLDSEDALDGVIKLHNEGMLFELVDMDAPLTIKLPPSELVDEPQKVRLHFEEPEFGFYTYVGWFCDAAFHCTDYSESRAFDYYLKAILAEHPEWRVAVVGAVLEDDVIRVANRIDALGFATTILTRYCIPGELFINLDGLANYQSEYLFWLREHGCDIEDNFLTSHLFDDEDDDEDDE
jgi:hypothetical protein